MPKSNPNLTRMQIEWTAPCGNSFLAEHWPADGPVRDVLLCVHGMGGAASDFHTLAEAAVQRGISCHALNLRGQGHDPQPARRGAVLDLEAVARDVQAFGREVLAAQPGARLWVCGESMGALVVAWMLAHRRFAPSPCGAVFSVPVVALRRPTPWVVRQIVRLLGRLVPGLRFYPSWFVSGKIEKLRVTRDEAHAERIRNSPQYIRAFTFRFLAQLSDLMASSPRLAGDITTPSLVLAAGQDVYVRPDQIRMWFDQLAAPDKTFRIYPEAHHLLWNDWDREQVMADIFAWMSARP